MPALGLGVRGGGGAGEVDLAGGLVVVEAVTGDGVGKPGALSPGGADAGHHALDLGAAAGRPHAGVGLGVVEEGTDGEVRADGAVDADQAGLAGVAGGAHVEIPVQATAALAGLEVEVVLALDRIRLVAETFAER